MASAVGKLNSLAENETFPSQPMESPALSQLPLEPYFDIVSPGNVTALVGKSAYLTCRVRNLGDKTVSHIYYVQISALITHETHMKLRIETFPGQCYELKG